MFDCRKTFIGIVKKGSTEEFDSLPYICTLLGSCLWVYYGIIKPGAYLVATVNAFGVVVEIIYVALFIFYAPRRKSVILHLQLILLFYLQLSIILTSHLTYTFSHVYTKLINGQYIFWVIVITPWKILIVHIYFS